MTRRGMALSVLGSVAALAALACTISVSRPRSAMQESSSGGGLLLYRRPDAPGKHGQDPTKDYEHSGLSFVAVETEPQMGVGLELNRFRERTGAKVHVVGKGQNWTGYDFKVRLWQQFVRSRLTKPNADKELVVLVDNRDLFWAGCELPDLRARYEKIVGQSPSSIVFSAELNCWAEPETCRSVPEPPAEVLHQLTSYRGGCSLKCNGTWHDVCTPCGRTYSNKYLNSGFIMGPPKSISQMLDWLLLALESGNYTAEYKKFGDQALFLKYWARHPDRVALDYEGELCMTATWLGLNAFKANASSGKVHSPMLANRSACFIHGAGYGRIMESWLLHQVSPGEELVPFKSFGEKAMPLVEAVVPPLISSPDLVQIPDGTDNFLDLPSGGGASAKVFSQQWQLLKASACPRATCAAVSEFKHVAS